MRAAPYTPTVYGQWVPGKWWRVLNLVDGTVKCETSSEDEARAAMGAGDTLHRQWTYQDAEWRLAGTATTAEEDPDDPVHPDHVCCPDCGDDPTDHTLHALGCRRIAQPNVLQCGPPWNPWPGEGNL